MISAIYAVGGKPVNRNAYIAFGHKSPKFKRRKKKSCKYAANAKKLESHEIGRITRFISAPNQKSENASIQNTDSKDLRRRNG